jgi:hypothetical protein
MLNATVLVPLPATMFPIRGVVCGLAAYIDLATAALSRDCRFGNPELSASAKSMRMLGLEYPGDSLLIRDQPCAA